MYDNMHNAIPLVGKDQTESFWEWTLRAPARSDVYVRKISIESANRLMVEAIAIDAKYHCELLRSALPRQHCFRLVSQDSSYKTASVFRAISSPIPVATRAAFGDGSDDVQILQNMCGLPMRSCVSVVATRMR